MPEYNDPVARDAIRQLRAQNESLQAQINLLKSSKGGVILDRGDHEADPAPVEGQVMVNYATDTPYHYARGGWHPFGGGGVPYPPIWPNAAVSSHFTEHRFWPGGWIVAPAFAYRIDASEISSPADSAFAFNGIRHDQSSADFASAAVSVSFTPADIGLPTGDGAPFYGVCVGMRVNGTGGNIGVRMSPKGYDPHASDTGYGSATFTTGLVKDYYGLFRLIYTRSAGFPITGYLRQFQADDVIELKCYRESGSGSVDLDNIYFIPYVDPGVSVTNLANQATHILSLSNYGDMSPTASYSGSPDEDYCDCGGGDPSVEDTQVRRGWRDPDLEWSGACSLSEGFAEDAMAFAAISDWIAYHPRHIYVACRLRGAGDVPYGQTDSGGYVSLGRDTLPVAQAHVYSDHWGFYYLGCHPHMMTAQGEYQVALWMPNQDDDFPAGFPYCSTGDTAAYEAMVGRDVFFSSSMYDWLHWQTGQYAYQTEVIP